MTKYEEAVEEIVENHIRSAYRMLQKEHDTLKADYKNALKTILKQSRMIKKLEDKLQVKK